LDTQVTSSLPLLSDFGLFWGSSFS